MTRFLRRKQDCANRACQTTLNSTAVMPRFWWWKWERWLLVDAWHQHRLTEAMWLSEATSFGGGGLAMSLCYADDHDDDCYYIISRKQFVFISARLCCCCWSGLLLLQPAIINSNNASKSTATQTLNGVCCSVNTTHTPIWPSYKTSRTSSEDPRMNSLRRIQFFTFYTVEGIFYVSVQSRLSISSKVSCSQFPYELIYIFYILSSCDPKVLGRWENNDV